MNRAFSREENTLGTPAGVPVRGRWIRGGPAVRERFTPLVTPADRASHATSGADSTMGH